MSPEGGEFGNNGASANGAASNDAGGGQQDPAPRKPGLTMADQNCFGCVALLLLAVISLAFWLFIYWRNADEFRIS